MFGSHILESRKLFETWRYQGKFRHKKRNVGEHSWMVPKIAHGLALWEGRKFKEHNVDIEKVLFMAINHDVLEIYTTDIISPVKYFSETLKNEIGKAEEHSLINELLHTIPKSWGKMYTDMFYELNELKTVESKIVKAADIIDSIYECMEEIWLGNKYYNEDIIRSNFNKLKNLNLMSVDYFLKYSIKDIGAEKYMSKDIQEYLDGLDFSEYF